MPIEKCKIQQVFHPGLSKSEKKNFISIKPMANFRKSRSRPLDIHDLSALPVDRLPHDKQPKATADAEPQDELQEAGMKGTVIPTFNECKERYVFPYKLPQKYKIRETIVEGRGAERRSSDGHTPTTAQTLKERKRALTAKRERAHVVTSDRLQTPEPHRRDSQASGHSQSGAAVDVSHLAHFWTPPAEVRRRWSALRQPCAAEGAEREFSGISLLEQSPERTSPEGTRSPASSEPRPASPARAADSEGRLQVPGAAGAEPEEAALLRKAALSFALSAAEATEANGGSPLRPSEVTGARPFAKGRAYSTVELQTMQKELAQPPTLGIREIRDTQSMFVERFPFEQYWAELPASPAKTQLMDSLEVSQ